MGFKEWRGKMSEAEKEETPPPLANVKSINAERDQAFIDILEEMLKMAKNGEISELCILGKVRGEDVAEVLWETNNRLELLGSIELARMEVLDSYTEEDEETEDSD